MRLRRCLGEGVHADSDRHENSDANLCWFWSHILYHSTYKTLIFVKAAMFHIIAPHDSNAMYHPSFLRTHITSISITVYNKDPLQSGLFKETHNLFELIA
jgi:hypothetical protein